MQKVKIFQIEKEETHFGTQLQLLEKEINNFIDNQEKDISNFHQLYPSEKQKILKIVTIDFHENETFYYAVMIYDIT